MPINWQDGASGGTPLSAANLNRLAVTADMGTPGTPTGDAVKAAAQAAAQAAFVAGNVYNSDGSRNTAKTLHVVLTPDGTDIQDLIIQ